MNFMRQLYDVIIFLLNEKEVKTVAVIYATLIIKGKRTFKSVPNRLKDEVKEILTSLACENLVEE